MYLLILQNQYCSYSAVSSKPFTMTSVIHINSQESLFMPQLASQLLAWSWTRSSSEFWGWIIFTICTWDRFHENTKWMDLWIPLLIWLDITIRNHSDSAIDGITNGVTSTTWLSKGSLSCVVLHVCKINQVIVGAAYLECLFPRAGE